MNAWTSVFTAVGVVNDCLIDLSCRSWKNPDRQTAALWSTIVSRLSIRTPRFLTAVENCSTFPFRNVNVCGRVVFSLCRVLKPNDLRLVFVKLQAITRHSCDATVGKHRPHAVTAAAAAAAAMAVFRVVVLIKSVERAVVGHASHQTRVGPPTPSRRRR